MDAPNLQENFIDDILSPSNTARKYRLINNCGELEAYKWILRSPNQKRAIGCKLMAYSTR